jgi:hypothetical protein
LPPGQWHRPSRFFSSFRGQDAHPRADGIPTPTPAATLNIEVVGDYMPKSAIDRLASASLAIAGISPFLGIAGTFFLFCTCLRGPSPFRKRRSRRERAAPESATGEAGESGQAEATSSCLP